MIINTDFLLLPLALIAIPMTSVNVVSMVAFAKSLRRGPFTRSFEARNAPPDGKDILEHRGGGPRMHAV